MTNASSSQPWCCPRHNQTKSRTPPQGSRIARSAYSCGMKRFFFNPFVFLEATNFWKKLITNNDLKKRDYIFHLAYRVHRDGAPQCHERKQLCWHWMSMKVLRVPIHELNHYEKPLGCLPATESTEWKRGPVLALNDTSRYKTRSYVTIKESFIKPHECRGLHLGAAVSIYPSLRFTGPVGYTGPRLG